MYPFPNFEPVCCSMSGSNCCFLICIQVSQEAVRWSGIPISWRIFQFVVSHTVKVFSIVNEAEVDVFLELSCLFYDPTHVGNLISGFSALSKSSLNFWKLSIHLLLKSHLKHLEHCFAHFSMWNEYNCVVVWTFFGIALLWDWEWKLTFSSPVATAEFSKFAGILSAAL